MKDFYFEIKEEKNLQIAKQLFLVKFMFSNKATKFDEIFTVDLTLCGKCQIDGEDFVNFFENELYKYI